MNAKTLQSTELYEIAVLKIKENPATFEPFDVHLVEKCRMFPTAFSCNPVSGKIIGYIGLFCFVWAFF